MPKIVSGSGHRTDKTGDSLIVRAELRSVAQAGLLRIGDVTEVICGMAESWDLAFGEAAADMGLLVTAAIPFKEQPDRWRRESRLRYEALLLRCHRVVYVSGPGYSDLKMEIRNRWMIDNSDYLLSCWNGSQGGTLNTIAYARDVGRPTLNVWSDFVAMWSKR